MPDRKLQVSTLEPDELLEPGEVAQLLKVDPKTVTRWCQGGKLVEGEDWIKTPGGHHRIRGSAIIRMFATPGERVATP